MDTIGIGVVGAGAIAAVFAERIGELEGVELRAVCAGHEEEIDGFAARFAVPTVHPDHLALAADKFVDAVYVVSPGSLHAEHATTMLRAGKHVLVEKPMALDAGQVAAMVAAARDADRLLMEAYPAPFEPNIAAVRDAVPRIPRRRRVVLIKDQYSSAFDAYKAGRNPVAFDPAFGGGSILDLGFYPVSLAVHLFGEPESVTAIGLLLENGADGQGVIVLGYDGFEVDCLHSKIASAGIGSQIGGELSALVFDDAATPHHVELLARGGASGSSRRMELVENLTRERTGSHLRYVIDAFVGLLRAGARESGLHPLVNTLAAHRVLDEARRQVGVRFPTDR